MGTQLPLSHRRAAWSLVIVPLAFLSFLLWFALASSTPPGRLAIEVGLLLSAYSVWVISTGSVIRDVLDMKDANVEFEALRAASIVVIFALLLVLLGFLNLFGVLPWS